MEKINRNPGRKSSLVLYFFVDHDAGIEPVERSTLN